MVCSESSELKSAIILELELELYYFYIYILLQNCLPPLLVIVHVHPSALQGEFHHFTVDMCRVALRSNYLSCSVSPSDMRSR